MQKELIYYENVFNKKLSTSSKTYLQLHLDLTSEVENKSGEAIKFSSLRYLPGMYPQGRPVRPGSLFQPEGADYAHHWRGRT